MQVKTLYLIGTKPSGRCNMLSFGVLFHHVGSTSVLSPLETCADGLASWVLVWPGLLENSTLIRVKAGWLSPASPETALHPPHPPPHPKFIFSVSNKGPCQSLSQGTFYRAGNFSQSFQSGQLMLICFVFFSSFLFCFFIRILYIHSVGGR